MAFLYLFLGGKTQRANYQQVLVFQAAQGNNKNFQERDRERERGKRQKKKKEKQKAEQRSPDCFWQTFEVIHSQPVTP